MIRVVFGILTLIGSIHIGCEAFCKGGNCIHGHAVVHIYSDFYICSCNSGYDGECCEIEINECSSNRCKHNSICVDKVNGYTCRCQPGYTGKYCQIDINECASNPCQNGKTCTDHVNSYTCACAAGYYGSHCQIDYDDCAFHSCQHGGTCSDHVNLYTCACTAGYLGRNCQINGHCLSNPCDNGGTCKPDQVNGYTCTCHVGYTGHNCEIAKPGKLHKAPVIIAPPIIQAKYYEKTSLICNVTGYPTPSVVWKHNDIVIQSSGNTLVIPSVTNTTSGDYTCIATNDAGVSQAKIQLLYTYDAPKIVSPPTSFVVTAGQSHNFTCVATGHPKPAIKWEFHSFVGDGPNFPPHVTTQNGSLLTLVRMQDSGTLTCTARNQFGSDSSTVHVIVKNGSPAVG